MNKDITNHPSALDIDEIWAAIEPQVDEINAQRKKRKPMFIYWLSGFILLVGLGIAGFFLFGDSFQTDTISNESISEPTGQTAATPSYVSENKALVVEHAVSPLAAEQETAPAAKTTLSTKAEIKEPGIFKNSPIVEKFAGKTLPSATAINSKPSNSEVDLATLSENNMNANNQIFTTTPIQEEIKENSNSTISAKEEKIGSLSPLTVANIDLTTTTDLPKLNFSIKNTKSLVPPPIYIERPTFSLEFQTGISAVNRTLNTTRISNNNLDTLVSLRNTFEEPLEALHANLLVNAHFPSGFFVSSGVGFTQINERYSNNSTVTEQVVDSMGIQKLIVNLTGDTIPMIGPVTSTRTTTFTKKYYNSYRMIDIPFFVGYQYDFGDWKTDFSLGVFANILLATEGRVPNTPTTDLDLDTNGDDIYRSRVDYSLQFGIGVSKSLTDKLSLRVNPMFRYYSRNFIKEDVGLNQRYLLFGGTVGLRMDL